MTCVPERDQFTSCASGNVQAREQILWLPINDIRLGMYVHPFSRESFLLSQRGDLDDLRSSGVKGLFVDMARSKPEPRARTSSASPHPSSKTNTRAGAFAEAARTLANVKAPVARLLNEARLGCAVSNKEIGPIVAEITNSVAANPSAIISLARIRTKDGFTYAHSIAVCALMANLAQRMGMDRSSQEELAVAGLLHDVGKLMVPDELLNKPGALTASEMEVMRSHVVQGHEVLLRGSGIPQVALDVCLHHHEKIDGSGYPDRLLDHQISLAAKMAAVCDVYDAITSNRPYKEAWAPSECLADMFIWRGHFDPKVLSAFIKSVGIYPVGSLLRMRSGHLGLVLDQHDEDLTRPLVRLFYAISERRRVPFKDIVVGGDCQDEILTKEDPRNWGFMDWDRQWPRMLAA